MKTKISLVLGMSFFLLSCQKNDDTETETIPDVVADPAYYYSDAWAGIYEGTSRHWQTKPSGPPDYSQLVTTVLYKQVSVHVNKSSLDSCLNFTITYNNTIIEQLNDLKFSASGSCFTSSGSGSGYRSLSVKFISDSLHYTYYSNCGMPCNSGINFVLGKE